MQVRFTLEIPDFIAYFQHTRRRDRQAQLVYWLSYFLLVTMAFIGGAFLVRDTWLGWPALISPVAIVLVLFPFFSRAQLIRSARRLVEQSDPRDLKQTITLRADGLQQRVNNTTTRHNWASIIRIDQTADHLFFFLSPKVALIVPTRAFDDTDAANAFVNQARRQHEQAQT